MTRCLKASHSPTPPTPSPTSHGETRTSQTHPVNPRNQCSGNTGNSSHSSGQLPHQFVMADLSTISLLRSFILSRPTRGKLKKRGILRERVFGCDLGEHLLNSGNEGDPTLPPCHEECPLIYHQGSNQPGYRLRSRSKETLYGQLMILEERRQRELKPIATLLA